MWIECLLASKYFYCSELTKKHRHTKEVLSGEIKPKHTKFIDISHGSSLVTNPIKQ